MQSHNVPTILKSTLCATVLLLLGAAMAVGQSVTATASGTVAVGASVTTAALTLTAGASPIDAGSVAVTGVSVPFSVDPTGCAAGLASGASCTMNVTFTPGDTGPFSDSVTVNATTTDSTQNPPVTTAVSISGSPVTLSGTGYRPTVTAPTTPLIFGDPGPGATSGAQTVTVTNTSDTPLSFNLTFDNSAYSVVSGGTCPTAPFVLNNTSTPANSCTVNLVFTAPAGPDTTAEAGHLIVTSTFVTSDVAVGGSPLALTDTGTPAGATGVTPTDVDLTAEPSAITLPDGSTVPMWGYRCAPTMAPSTCRSLNPNPAGWSPVVITIPTGQDLAIELKNSLPNSVPTSLVIVGQLGGGLGATATSMPSPAHGAQDTTWPIAATGPQNVPPPQGDRVQSFSTEVATGTTQRLVWKNPRPGTYLIESGTHPSIQGPMGLYGVLVVTAAPTTSAAGTAYPAGGTTSPAVTYNAEIPLVFSEIDPVQNTAVSTAVNTPGFSETAVWSGQPGGCGNPSSPVGVINTCYPPAVNYKPLFYLINGVAFNGNAAGASLFPVSPAAGVSASGSVLVRLVNAGLRMHVPSIVGSQVAGQTGATNPIVTGFKLIAEDGNPLPGIPRVQSEVFMAAGKTYDVMINVPSGPPALPVFDRELSLSTNSIGRDGGMLAYISVNGAGIAATTAAIAPAQANNDIYSSVIAGKTLTVSDPSKGVLANDVNVHGAKVQGTVPGLTLNLDGTFTYSGGATTFTYCGNGATSGPACATVNLGAATIEAASGITCPNAAFSSTVATTLSIKPPGILAGCTDAAGYPVTVNAASVTPASGLTLSVDPNGGFNASVSGAGSYSFTFKAQNSQNTVSATAAAVTLNFPSATGLVVNVVDGKDKSTPVADYRWIIEEDRTFYINPACTTNPPPAGCPGAPTTTNPTGIVPTFGTNFHTSYMPVVAAGCTGPLSCESGQTVGGVASVCDVGNGVCRQDLTGNGEAPLLPNSVHLDPTKRYYISVLPGDAANSFETGNAVGGHGMGGAPIACVPTTPAVTCTASGTFPAVTVLVQPNPFPPSKLSVFVFEDDFPLNGEQDGGGGIDVLSPNEPGLGGFNITLFDDAGGPGDATGQMTYDMFNMPLSNGLAGTIDPSTGLDACPISGANQNLGSDGTTASPTGITGTIVTCPRYEADNKTLSPLAGQAVVSNLMPGRYGVVATPAADRIARGEEWLQTNTLDGQKAHDSFLRIGEPSFFQEYGPAGYHVSIGFANPGIINARKQYICDGTDPNSPNAPKPYNCNNSVTGTVTTERMSRTPDERLYSSGDNSSFSFTQCYVSFGDADGEDFAFTKCDANGNFTLSGLPEGDWRITVFDQWNDMLVDGLSTPVRLGGGATLPLGQIAINQWQANIYTSTFFDKNGNGVRDSDEEGLSLVATNNRFRDGSYSNFNNTDLSGNAGFNEIFPLFSWYVIETDTTRYKSTGVHVVYDAGGPSDGSANCAASPSGALGDSNIAHCLANAVEQIPVPTNLRVPGAYYCANADCTSAPAPLDPTATPTSPGGSTGRVDPPFWFGTEGWQGFSGQNNFIEFGKKPYAVGETGGIHGEVIYASTRPFDDPALLIHTSWTPDVPGVTVNLYKEGTAPDGSTSLTLIDTTKTSSWDDWTQGFRSDGMPNMNCPGQGRNTGTNADLFFFSIFDQPDWLDQYNNGGTPAHTLPNDAQFKCYDGMHNWNQVQPAPYDGMYQFPSVTSFNPMSGKPSGAAVSISTISEAAAPSSTVTVVTSAAHNLSSGSIVLISGVTPAGFDGSFNVTVLSPTSFTYTVASTGLGTGTVSVASLATAAGSNCTACVPNPDTTDPYRVGTPMLPAGKYVVEMIVPPGYELVKEEDKNILIGDNYIAPVTQEFAGLGNIFIMPDQAEVSAYYNANNAQNPTTTFGRTTLPSHEGDTGSVETFWPCVGAARVVPDFISLFPQSGEVAPFAGATRNLCDRKEVTLTEQSAALAKFWIFSSTHVAAHFTGVITDDFTSEFDPFSPQFGEKFAPPDLPISIKDWSGTEIARTYADHWGAYNGLTYSTWEVNPPNPTGYAPTMMVTCMNDPGTGAAPDPLFNPQYSQFCYEIPFMPGQTQYMDTPVVPTSAFAGAGYNNPDCSYPAATPAIAEVGSNDGVGPWASAAGSGHTLTITALGDQLVPNNAYVGPSASTAPYNQKKVTRHYGFGTCTLTGTACTNGASATLNALNNSGASIPLNITSWSDTSISAGIPNSVTSNPNFKCAMQQQAQYGGPGSGTPPVTAAACGQLVITTSTGQQSIDTVTVTVGGKAPTHVAASASIQPTIDAAKPGDLIIVDPGVHQELLLMWKPVRLQGVGAASSVINANTHPAGKLDTWRARVNCLFGLGLTGSPTTWNSSCATGWTGFNASPNVPQVDRLPLEATVGWDASLNGNLAELLQEPSLMGALEGAGITVLSKGVDFHGSSPWDPTLLAGFPTGTTLLTANNCGGSGANPFPSSFQCNPSSIDGLGITNSSQGGGGVFVHGWGHNLQIANNRIYNNAGTLSGGINVGQGEFPPSYLGGAAAVNTPPGSCMTSGTANLELPYCHNLNVNVHNNAVTSNSSTGDELFSATPAGAGGVSFCTGSDFYKFNYNWVCGNLSTGDGGGIAHIGFSYGGDIEHNTIVFNQSTNPTIATNGGGLLIMGSPDADPPCGANTDLDCVPPLGSVGPSDGTGPGLVINANLIMGNSADSGSGGGLRLQHINGSDVISFPNGNSTVQFPGITGSISPWYSPLITNNIIVNNVAGWDGGGVSLLDALNVNLINNTIASNDSTASAGVLFNTLGAPLASTQQDNCIQSGGTTMSCPQVAGLVSVQNSATLVANLPGSGITCPSGHPNCAKVSYPELYNNVFWQNRSFYIGVGSLGTGTLNQQNVVALFNAAFTSTGPTTGTPAASQTITGGCPAGVSYWDIGVRGDTTPTNHASTVTLSPEASILTSISGYAGGGAGFRANLAPSNLALVSEYCNGSRTPPELKSSGWQVPPGISDATVPNPVFNLSPAATVDEGNNWINLSWGPLAMTNPVTNVLLGNYGLSAGSPAISYITPSNSSTTYAAAPSFDFFGTARKTNNAVDVGAVEFASSVRAAGAVSPTSLTFSAVAGTTSAAQTLTLSNTGGADLTGISESIPGGAPFSRPGGTAGGTCAGTLAAGATCTINVVFSPAAAATGTLTSTLTINASVSVTGSPVSLTGNVIAPIRTATVTPNPLAFGNWATGTTSNPLNLTVTNTGNVALAGGTVAFGGGAPQPFARVTTGTFPAGAPNCGGTLALGASCTIKVRFAPATAASFSRTLTVAYASATVTPTPVTLTGTGVATRAAVSITPLTITLPSCSPTPTLACTTGTGTVTLANTAGAGGSSVAVTGVVASGGTMLTYLFSSGPLAGPDTCTGANIAPGTSCTVSVRFTNITSPRGTNRAGTITFTDTGAGSPQSGNLIGFATP